MNIFGTDTKCISMAIALLIFSSISVASCLFMSLYFLTIRKENKFQDLSLGLLFLAISLRISKSIFYYIFPDLSAIGVAFGFLGFASMGPLFLSYFKFSVQKVKQFTKADLIHLLFPVLGFIVISSFNGYASTFYFLAKISLASYILYTAKQFVFNKQHIQVITNWHQVLFYGMICLLAALTFQFFVGSMQSYTIGTALASLIVYVVFFYALKSPMVIKKPIRNSLPQELIDKIIYTIEVDTIYTQPAITLSQFSEAIDTPTYLVSKATKAIYNKSFPETINSFRIKAIKAKLEDPKHLYDRIEDLAYDAGFNTASAFYTAFKKETQQTPREYQKIIAVNTMQSN